MKKIVRNKITERYTVMYLILQSSISQKKKSRGKVNHWAERVNRFSETSFKIKPISHIKDYRVICFASAQTVKIRWFLVFYITFFCLIDYSKNPLLPFFIIITTSSAITLQRIRCLGIIAQLDCETLSEFDQFESHWSKPGFQTQPRYKTPGDLRFELVIV